jgi:hypothetical protein
LLYHGVRPKKKNGGNPKSFCLFSQNTTIVSGREGVRREQGRSEEGREEEAINKLRNILNMKKNSREQVYGF